MTPPSDSVLEALPTKRDRNVTVRVDRSAERALRKRHPWLFESGVREQSHEGRAGDHAIIFDRNRDFLAIGLFDPHSPIRVRILHTGKPQRVDASFFARRIQGLAALRAPLLRRGTDGYRLVNGENEGMPGLVADRYGEVIVIKLYTPAWIPHLRAVMPPLVEATGASRVVLRLSRDTAARSAELHGLHDGRMLLGEPLASGTTFREEGLRFEVDPIRGQKTGFFLDQRDNRVRVAARSEGARVLNAFSYSGGFSVHAARGGAERVLSLDQSAPALRAAERNFALNQGIATVRRARHETLQADAFEALRDLAVARRRFGIVVIDPPSMARNQAQIQGALHAYERLARLGTALLEPGGLLVMASCSARVSEGAFFECVHRGALSAGRALREEMRTAHALDHPIGFPEGSYLKCVFART